MSMSYGIEEHRHRFAAWAASNAASVKGCRFSVEQGKAILEEVGLKELLYDPTSLPPPNKMDVSHRAWRLKAIASARRLVLESTSFNDGIAAKLINVYLKAGFVCGGHHRDESVKAIHPPIDRELLKALDVQDAGGLRSEWKKAWQKGWSKFNSDEYEAVISNLRRTLGKDRPLWEIEEHWQGYQSQKAAANPI